MGGPYREELRNWLGVRGWCSICLDNRIKELVCWTEEHKNWKGGKKRAYSRRMRRGTGRWRRRPEEKRLPLLTLTCVLTAQSILCIVAGMFALRVERDHTVNEDFMKAARKVRGMGWLQVSLGKSLSSFFFLFLYCSLSLFHSFFSFSVALSLRFYVSI